MSTAPARRRVRSASPAPTRGLPSGREAPTAVSPPERQGRSNAPPPTPPTPPRQAFFGGAGQSPVSGHRASTGSLLSTPVSPPLTRVQPRQPSTVTPSRNGHDSGGGSEAAAAAAPRSTFSSPTTMMATSPPAFPVAPSSVESGGYARAAAPPPPPPTSSAAAAAEARDRRATTTSTLDAFALAAAEAMVARAAGAESDSGGDEDDSAVAAVDGDGFSSGGEDPPRPPALLPPAEQLFALVRANGGIREARRWAEYIQRYPAGLDLDGCKEITGKERSSTLLLRTSPRAPFRKCSANKSPFLHNSTQATLARSWAC